MKCLARLFCFYAFQSLVLNTSAFATDSSDEETSVGINEQDEAGKNTLLHHAILKGNQKMVQGLLNKGANPNIQNIGGNTPLHLAVRNLRADIVGLLVKSSVDRKIKNLNGRTALGELHKEMEDVLEMDGQDSERYNTCEKIHALLLNLYEKPMDDKDIEPF